MKKKILALLLVFALLVPAANAFAATPPTAEVSPGGGAKYTYISTIAPKLSVSGTTATYSLKVTGKSSVTSISATLQLQKLSGNTWSDYGSSWSASSSSDLLSTSGTKTVASGGTYRLMVTVTVYTANGSETASANS